jgi:mannose-6-phosphate isomerase-like protein (cupin superfamily)
MTFAPGMVVFGPGEGQRVPFMGNLHFNKAVAADTNGSWALVEQHMTGANPPLHQHDREDEAWYVLQGRVRVYVVDTEIDGEPEALSWRPAACRTRSRDCLVMTSSCCCSSHRPE